VVTFIPVWNRHRARGHALGNEMICKKSVEKKNIEGGGGVRRFLRAGCAWAGSGVVAGTNWANLVMLSLAGGSVVDALGLRI
jgi:hypothetical protein